MRSLLGVGVGVGVGLAVAACGGTVQQDVATLTVGTQAGSTSLNLDVAHGPYSPSIAVDATGTVHVLYYGWSPDSPAAARYGECAKDCDALSSWTFATLPATGEETSVSHLALDSQGRPRFLITRSSGAGSSRYDLVYAACDAGCTAPSSWSLTPIGQALDDVGTSGVPSPMPIAIDAKDAVWVVFVSSLTGATVKSCADGCTDAARWSETTYATSRLDYPLDLAVDSAGTLHMTAGPDAYAEIAPGAGAPKVRTIDVPGGAARMRIDSVGRPRILWDGATGKLAYVSCDEACAEDGTWSATPIPVTAGSAFPGDLVLDAKGAPHVVYASPNPVEGGDTTRQALGYATCEADCETARPAWRFQVLQSAKALWAGTPMPDTKEGPPNPAPLWVGPIGLALDLSGAPRLAYEVAKTDFCPVATGTPVWCPSVLRYSAP